MSAALQSIFPMKLSMWSLDPRTKLFLIATISSIAMIGDIEGARIYPRLILLLLPCFLFFINRQARKAIIFSLIVAAAWFGEAFGTNGSLPLMNMIVMVISGVITRFVPPLLMGNFLLYSTQIEELIASLEKLRVPKQITIPLASMFRFFPTIREEAKFIGDAMRMRGISSALAIKAPVALLEYRLVPLLNSMIKIANELAIASMTRGLGSTKRRTSIVEIKMRSSDVIFLLISSLLVILYFIL